MKDIKIFVSHRTDQNSDVIDSPIYYNVRCGAAVDEHQSKYNTNFLNDNIGENISRKKDWYSELTVQYWAWKNMDADYFGLCHYRRYLSFSDEVSEESEELGNFLRTVTVPFVDNNAIEKYHLDDIEKINSELDEYDIICVNPINVRKYTNCKTVKSCWEVDTLWHNKDDLEILRKVVKDKYPEYLSSYDDYFSGKFSYLYDTFIMKREYFHQYSEWLFDILFEVEKHIDPTNYNFQKTRTLGTMSERLLGVFYMYLENTTNCKIKRRQLLFFENTSTPKSLLPAFKDSNIPIILLSSNYYVPYVSVCIQSILNYASDDKNYDIIIFESQITQDNKKILKHIVKDYKNVSLRFYNPRHLIYNAKFNVVGAYSVEAYYRILAPYILKNYSKAICMDSDLILKSDLAELYDTDISSHSIAAVRDVVFYGFLNGYSPEYIDYTKNEFHMKNPYNYVNTGVMVMNLEKLRNEYTLDEMVEFAQSQKFKIQEQDALNLLLEDSIKYLAPEWNVYTYCGGRYNLAIYLAPKKDYDNYMSARLKPKIIHYAGVVKPWHVLDDDKAEEFWSVARTTQLYETILYRSINDVSNWYRYQPTKPKLRVRFKNTARDLLVPYGSKRREALKKVFYLFINKE